MGGRSGRSKGGVSHEATDTLEVKALVRGGRIYWLVDGSPSLHALVKGSSANEAMERAVALMHIMCHILNCSIYFNYIDSDSNFSDCISRALQNDAWAAKHGISTKVMQPEAWWWRTDLKALWHALEGYEKSFCSASGGRRLCLLLP